MTSETSVYPSGSSAVPNGMKWDDSLFGYVASIDINGLAL